MTPTPFYSKKEVEAIDFLDPCLILLGLGQSGTDGTRSSCLGTKLTF